MEEGDGVLILSLRELFAKIKEQTQLCDLSKVYIIRCSYFEIYNDSVYDLLNPQKELAFNEPLQLNEDIRVNLLAHYLTYVEEGIRSAGPEGVRC